MRYLMIVPILLIAACGGGSSSGNAPPPAAQNSANEPVARTDTPGPSERDRQLAGELAQQAAQLIYENDNTGALDLAQRAIKLDPQRPEYHAQLGYILEKLGRFEEALTAYSHAESGLVGDEQRRARRGAARAAKALAGKARNAARLDSALVYAEQAVELDRDVPAFHLELGHVHYALKDFDKAAQAYEFAVDLAVSTEQHEALHWKAQAEYAAGRYRDAIDTYTRLIDQGAEGYDAWGMRGYCYTQTGERERAIRDFNQAVQRTDDPGKKAEYEEVLRQLIELGNQD